MANSTATAAAQRPPAKSTRREVTRDRLRTVAAQLFAATGFDSVSVEDILTEAGLSRRTFYSYFSNKHELAASIVDAALASGCDILSDAHDTDESINDIINCYQTLWSDHAHALTMISSLDKATAQLVAAGHKRFGAKLKAMLKQAESKNMLKNNDADYSFRVITKTAVPLLRVYADHPQGAKLYRAAMQALLGK